MINLFKVYIPQIVNLVIAVACISAGIINFGNGLVFDRIVYSSLLFTLFVCRRNVNVAGVVLVILAEHVFLDVYWFLLPYFDNAWLKLLSYSAAVVAAFYLRHDGANKNWPAAILAFSIATELYWVIVDYDAPQIAPYVVQLYTYIAARWFLFLRYEYTAQLFPGKEKICRADGLAFRAYQIGIYIQLFNICEYLVRHLTSFSPTVVYQFYPYGMQTLAIYILWLVLRENTQALLEKRLKA